MSAPSDSDNAPLPTLQCAQADLAAIDRAREQIWAELGATVPTPAADLTREQTVLTLLRIGLRYQETSVARLEAWRGKIAGRHGV